MKIFKKLLDTKVSTSYMFILFGVSALMLMGYFSYAWFTVQGVQQYSVVTGNLNGTVAIGSNSVAINGTGVITYTPSTDNDTITLTVTNTNDRTVKNSIYYYDLSDSSIEIGYTSDSSTIPTVEGVSVEAGKSLIYKIKIKGATGKQIKIGSSMGLNNSNLTLPSRTNAFGKMSDPIFIDTLVAQSNPEDLDYNIATDNQKNQMWAFSHDKTDQTGALTDYRYIGANPNNYVKFNDELWRIIGVFYVDDGTGTLEKRMKIIRNESIGYYAWDNKDTAAGAETNYGKNNWPDARLNYLLNEGHEYNSAGGSLYWNRKKGVCYCSSNNGMTNCDFTSTGLTEEAREMIGSTKWYLGGFGESPSYLWVLTSEWYNYERGTKVYSGHSTSWVGKIGLMYLSDYGYATSGGTTTDRNSCLAKELYYWDNSKYTDCVNNDWIYNANIFQWTITPQSDKSNYVFFVRPGGWICPYDIGEEYDKRNAIRPTVYLKASIKITGGNGSSTQPFTLSE